MKNGMLQWQPSIPSSIKNSQWRSHQESRGDWRRIPKKDTHASDYTIGAILGQKWNGRFHVIHYADKVLNGSQINYATMEKEILAVLYALKKFRSYHVGSKIIVHTDHLAI